MVQQYITILYAGWLLRSKPMNFSIHLSDHDVHGMFCVLSYKYVLQRDEGLNCLPWVHETSITGRLLEALQEIFVSPFRALIHYWKYSLAESFISAFLTWSGSLVIIFHEIFFCREGIIFLHRSGYCHHQCTCDASASLERRWELSLYLYQRQRPLHQAW